MAGKHPVPIDKFVHVQFNGMEHAFQTCVHCGTLNFEGRKHCSCCKFRLFDATSTEVTHNYGHWNSVIVGVVLVAICLLLAAAFMVHPYELPHKLRYQPDHQHDHYSDNQKAGPYTSFKNSTYHLTGTK